MDINDTILGGRKEGGTMEGKERMQLDLHFYTNERVSVRSDTVI